MALQIPSWLSHSECQQPQHVWLSVPLQRVLVQADNHHHSLSCCCSQGSGKATAKLLSHATNTVRCRCVLFIFFSFESSFSIKCWKSQSFPTLWLGRGWAPLTEIILAIRCSDTRDGLLTAGDWCTRLCQHEAHPHHRVVG